MGSMTTCSRPTPSWSTHYQAGDQIYLFGFSRGAYTVRVLAGLIHKIGLITPEQVNLAGSGLIAYKQFSSDEAPKLRAKLKSAIDAAAAEDTLPQTAFDNAAQFARITSTRWPTIRFVGVWDTVASVIVPRPDRFYWPSLEELAFTLVNPSVQTFRQAISIDERRCMFRLKKWDDPQTYKHNRFNEAHAEPQDILQVWFAGVHADIGGGYPEKQSGLSKYPLLWMIDEATKCGLQVNQATVNQLAWGIQRKGSPYSYVVPDVRGDLHTSLRGAWWILEYLPKSAKYKEWPARQTSFRLLHPGRRAALDSRRRHHPRIRRPAHGRDAELSAGEFAGAVREVSDAGAAGACERGGGGGCVRVGKAQRAHRSLHRCEGGSEASSPFRTRMLGRA